MIRMVSKERSSATKSRPRLLCCFTGSPVSDTDRLDSPVCNSSHRSQHSSSWWSKFRAKKKTVPISADTGTEYVTEISEEDMLQKSPEKSVPSAKKGYFGMFRKKTGSNRNHSKLNDMHTNNTKDSPKKAICQVFSRCASPNQQPALLCEVPEPIEIRTSPTRTASLDEAKASPKTKARSKKRRVGTEPDHRQLVVVLLMLAVTLGTMLLDGRALAIVCTSAWFYMSPYVKYVSRINNNVDMKSRREGRSIEVESRVDP